MSRIGQKPIDVAAGVEVRVDGRQAIAKGAKGELTVALPEGIDVAVEGSQVTVTRSDDGRGQKSLHGLVRSLIANAVEGVSKGFEKQLEISGVGYRASVQGQTLNMLVGLSDAVIYTAKDGVSLSVNDTGTVITVSGADKQMVGDAAARIRGFRPAEPYKGKGVQYKGERIRRKVGKTVA
ncbi:MAG: 50S ribosomal protein L6 [Kiritimatiellia bacterium]|nr:50S ribosomal protein L6 [Kiritimatiellia bacterium]MDP6631628.1 50S ribosomal protein L6 [Kiritimatiellia bacterium]MDP6810227.1 50S ribosomal protein L6 [Kiritimatiellia bacterium]MDP7022867.1 50S ribosomal protein L6 [Kiritimatiellia bacterium]